MKRTFDYVLSQRTGLPVPYSSVTVYLAGTLTKATLYSANDIASAQLTNPVIAAADGSYAFYVADGSYDLVVRTPSGAVVNVPDLEIYDSEDLLIGPALVAQVADITEALQVGRFIMLPNIYVPVGTDLVQTSGHTLTGIGGARYVFDATVDAAFVAAHPLTASLSKNGRGFLLSEQFPTPEMAGARGDGVTDDSPSYIALVAHMATPFIRATAGASYLMATVVALKSGTILQNSQATFICAGSGTLFNVEALDSVVIVGGNYNGNKAARAVLGFTGTSAAFRMRATTNFSLTGDWKFYGGYANSICITDVGGTTPSTGRIVGGKFYDDCGIAMLYPQDFKIDGDWIGAHYAPISMNSTDNANRLLTGLDISARIDEATRIGVEIKFAVGMRADITVKSISGAAGGSSMGMSVPNCRNGRIRAVLTNAPLGSSYGIELPGNCSGTIIEGGQFEDIGGATVQFSMGISGFADDVKVINNKFVRCGLADNPGDTTTRGAVRLFRGLQVTRYTLSAITGTFQQGERVYLQASGSYVASANGKRGMLAGIDIALSRVYIAGLPSGTGIGTNIAALTLANADVLVGETSGATATLSSGATVDTGVNVSALRNWSRGQRVEVSGNTFDDCWGIEEFESGTLGANYINNQQILRTVHRSIVTYRGQDYTIDNNKAVKLPSAPAGNYFVRGATGATDGKITKNKIYGAVTTSLAFTGEGTQVIMRDNVADSCLATPYSYTAVSMGFSMYDNNLYPNSPAPTLTFSSMTFARSADTRKSRCAALPNDPRDGLFGVGSTFELTSGAVASASNGWRVTSAGYVCQTAWTATAIAAGAYVHNASKVYLLATAGAGAAANAPTHTAGTVTGADGYAWTYVGARAGLAALAVDGALVA